MRARELLDRFGLTDAADRPVKTYSGGMRRRLDLAGALVGEAPVLFLDEPTSGLDPGSRIDLWEVIRELVAGGTTLLLTTQYLEEADQLAHDVVVIDHGRAIAQGTPAELKSQVGGERIEVTLLSKDGLEAARTVLARFTTGEVEVDTHRLSLVAPITGGAPVLTQALHEFDRAGVDLLDVGLRRPTLDEAFLTLTGHHCDDEEEVA